MELQDLISPISQSEFLDKFWEKDVLHVSRKDSSYFSLLRNEQSLEETIQLFCREWGDVSLARAGTSAAECPYVSDPPDLRVIAKAFREKYTVVVNDLQLKNVGVAHLCRSIERAFFCRANVNAYLTNADSQGLKAHYDDDDVFILQLKGKKTWKIYRDHVELPIAKMAYVDALNRDSPYDMYELLPGDLLYLPRGVFHEAATEASVSLHLTVSLSTLRWVDLVCELVQASAEVDVDLRRSLSPSHLKGLAGEISVEADVRSLLDRMVSRASIDRVVHRLQDRLQQGLNRVALVDIVGVCEPDSLTESCRLELAPDQMCCVEHTESSCKLKTVGAEFEFPVSLAEIPRFLCTVKEFSPSELPGAISAKAKIEVAQQFLNRGFVVRRNSLRARRSSG
ncbi:JmjC domain-containing protein [Bradyrhizobium sp. USDA 4520]